MLKRSLALALLLVPVWAGAAPAGGAPKLVQLSYHEESGAQGRDQFLGAFVRGADAVKFATGFGGKKARAHGRYKDSSTDTDINSDAKHPWVVPMGEPRQVVHLVRRSLEENGDAAVRLRMKRDGRVRKERVVIKLSECSLEPPLYPATCEVRP